jgi:hypothetical protein
MFLVEERVIIPCNLLILLMVCTMLQLFMFLVTCTNVPGGGEGDHPLQPVDPPHGLHHAPALHVPGYLY